MIPLLFALANFNCVEAQELIDSVNISRTEGKGELIQIIKDNTDSKCYERPELNS